MKLLYFNYSKQILQKKEIILFIILILFSFLHGQYLIDASPYNIIKMEKNNTSSNYITGLIRPVIFPSNSTFFSLKIQSMFSLNDNRPNAENIGNIWIGKGIGSYNELSFYYSSKYLTLSLVPYYFLNQNYYVESPQRTIDDPERSEVFNVLNDQRYYVSSPFVSSGFRETELLFHYKQFGIGLSNKNLWWGPGFHSSLTMTNNTAGFPHLVIGTINDKKINNIGYGLRYFFSKLNKVNGKPYYTALVGSMTFYNEPTISIGFSRNYLSGGFTPGERTITTRDAALLPFESLFVDTKKVDDDIYGGHDYWDQTISGFVVFDFIKSRAKFFIELGTDDHRQNFSDLRSQPEHNSAIIVGLRKYGLFNNDYLLSGFEYANIKKSYTNKFRTGGHWWWKDWYSYSTYEGRRWAAHSGSDSDDLLLFIGIDKDEFSFIPSFNYERHGIVTALNPEVKLEIRLNIILKFKSYNVKIYLENEYIYNSDFIIDKKRNSNFILFGINKDIRNILIRSVN